MAKPPLFVQFQKFLLVGGAATAIQYLILVLLVQVFALDPAISSAIGFSVSAIANYALNHRFTFRSSLAHRTAAFRFALVAILGLVVTFCLMTLAERSGLNYVIAQILTSIVVLVMNFLIGSVWTFK